VAALDAAAAAAPQHPRLVKEAGLLYADADRRAPR
jgi:hypothetical protein